MNYLKTYNRFMASRKLVPYEGDVVHTHHIRPRYMGLDNSPSNLVKLSVREHILAHFMLCKIYNNLQDFVAYTALSGKTDEIEKMKVELARIAVKKALTGKKIENSHLKDKSMIDRILATKLKKYGSAGIYSEEHRKNILNSLHKSINSPEAKKKATLERIHRNANMSKEDKILKYGKCGQDNNHFGKERGYYLITNPEGVQIKYKNQSEVISKTGISQSTLVRHRNNGTINSKSKAKSNNKWNGWKIEYFNVTHSKKKIN